MNDEDVALFRQAEGIANSGQTQAAYQMFCILRERYPEQVEVLFWILQTTSNASEARHTIDTIKRLQPLHPMLPRAESFHQRKLQDMPVYVPLAPVLTCPYCGTRAPAIIRDKVSTGGIVTLVVLLFVFFPLFWVGLLIKDNYYVCSRCGSRITMAG